jgi:hypothetical protein
MKSIHIENSYQTWQPRTMLGLIMDECVEKYDTPFANEILNRS